MPMTAAVFSADGSILAVAAETLITLWDPDKNALVAVIGDPFTPISVLSFVGNSEYLISLFHGSNPQLAVWDLSKLSMFWSYKLHAEAVSTSKDGCQFAVLALSNSSIETAIKDQGGLVLLFDAKKPVPMSTWMVKKVKGGGLAFLSHEASAPITDREIDGSGSPLLVYMNSDHEYVIFDPHNFNETQISTNVHRSNLDADETVNFGYASIYGELPKFDIQKEKIPEIPFVPSERLWATIFSESSHVLPPLRKLCCLFGVSPRKEDWSKGVNCQRRDFRIAFMKD